MTFKNIYNRSLPYYFEGCVDNEFERTTPQPDSPSHPCSNAAGSVEMDLAQVDLMLGVLED